MQVTKPYYSNLIDLASIGSRQYHRPAKPADSPEVRRFKDAVREAEKSTLVFNLNLGKVPIVNQDTMSTRATVAINEMAAAAEESRSSVPSPDTMSAIDDVLSVVTGMKFYGRATKSFRKTGDSQSGAYCTLPIRYDFTDKDTRSYAETVLKEKCKIQCSTPYPTILRETIKQVMNKVKTEIPNSFVKVNVDTNSMNLKVSYRPMIPPGSKEEKRWTNLSKPIPIPKEALDIGARKVPDGFTVDFDLDLGIHSSQGMDVELPLSPSPTSSQQNGNNSAKKNRSVAKNAARQLPL
jgi:hypothetical protein